MAQTVTFVLMAIMMILLALPLWLANLADRRRLAGSGGGVAGNEGPVTATPAFEPGIGASRPELGGDNGQVLAVLAYLIVAVLYGLLFLAGVAAQLLAGTLASGMGAGSLGFTADQWQSCGLGLWLPALVGLAAIVATGSAIGSALDPIDPRRCVHAVALSYITLIIVNLLATVTLLPQLAGAAARGGAQNPLTTIPQLWAQDIYLALLSAIGVGWLSRRSWRQMLARLGMAVPSWRQVGAGVAIGLLLVPLVVLLTYLAKLLNIPQDANVDKISEALLGGLVNTPLGIVTLGAAAALGEETLFRGALQPRFGLIFTTVLFALTHNQYGFSLSTLMVIILGLVLGVVRQRSNTVTSMIVHAVYNSSVGLATFLSLIK